MFRRLLFSLVLAFPLSVYAGNNDDSDGENKIDDCPSGCTCMGETFDTNSWHREGTSADPGNSTSHRLMSVASFPWHPYWTSTSGQMDALSAPTETGMPPGNSVSRVWRNGMNGGISFVDAKTEFPEDTKTIYMRGYMRMSANYNEAGNESTGQCNPGKMQEIDFGVVSGNNAGGMQTGTNGYVAGDDLIWSCRCADGGAHLCNGSSAVNCANGSGNLTVGDALGEWLRMEMRLEHTAGIGNGSGTAYFAERKVRISDGKIYGWPRQNVSGSTPWTLASMPDGNTWPLNLFRGIDSSGCNGEGPWNAGPEGAYRDFSYVMVMACDSLSVEGGGSAPNWIGPAGEVEPDTDSDGIPDHLDNCKTFANADSAFCDTDQDGYGNGCDGDFDNDFFTDSGDFNGHLNPDIQAGHDSDNDGTDMNCDSYVDASDNTMFNTQYQGTGKPGPSGLSCAGTASCP